MSGAGHLLVLPILIPLVAGALMLLYDDRQRRTKLVLGLASAVALLVLGVELLARSKGAIADGGGVSYYLMGNWPPPIAIVLVLDRLSAMMLLLTSLLAIPALIYSGAGWHRQGQHFHSLFQFLLAGLNGAFLTGDIFNLFVFFEVLLAASYGLLLHGSGQVRVRAGLHYIAINLSASFLFLIGVAMIYGVTGTLNMADLAARIPDLPAEDRPLLHAAAGVLGIAFLVKAGMWPLSFWLSTAYAAASAPVAAMFAIMTKVGVYIVLRLGMLLFGTDAGASAGFGADVLKIGGMATILFGIFGILASQGLGRITAHLVLTSSGTVLAVTGFALDGGGATMLAGAMYYLVSSTLATSALFLLTEPMEREEGSIAALLALTADAYGIDEPEPEHTPEDEQAGLGPAVPGALTILGFCFIACVILLAGLPPLSGFVGKFAMLSGALNPSGLGRGGASALVWVFMALILLTGVAVMVSLLRIGIQTFWANEDGMPKVFAVEIAPIVGLLVLTGALTVQAQPAMRYLDATAQLLFTPHAYIAAVAQAQPHTPEVEDAEGAAP